MFGRGETNDVRGRRWGGGSGGRGRRGKRERRKTNEMKKKGKVSVEEEGRETGERKTEE